MAKLVILLLIPLLCNAKPAPIPQEESATDSEFLVQLDPEGFTTDLPSLKELNSDVGTESSQDQTELTAVTPCNGPPSKLGSDPVAEALQNRTQDLSEGSATTDAPVAADDVEGSVTETAEFKSIPEVQDPVTAVADEITEGSVTESNQYEESARLQMEHRGNAAGSGLGDPEKVDPAEGSGLESNDPEETTELAISDPENVVVTTEVANDPAGSSDVTESFAADTGDPENSVDSRHANEQSSDSEGSTDSPVSDPEVSTDSVSEDTTNQFENNEIEGPARIEERQKTSNPEGSTDSPLQDQEDSTTITVGELKDQGDYQASVILQERSGDLKESDPESSTDLPVKDPENTTDVQQELSEVSEDPENNVEGSADAEVNDSPTNSDPSEMDLEKPIENANPETSSDPEQITDTAGLEISSNDIAEGSGSSTNDHEGSQSSSNNSGDLELAMKGSEESGSSAADPESLMQKENVENTEKALTGPTESSMLSDELSTEADNLEGSGFSDTTESDLVEYAQRSDIPRSFKGYRVYRVILPTEEAVERILKLEEEPGIEFWADPKLLLRPRGLFVTSAADIMVAPDLVENLESVFTSYKLPFSILIHDVEEAIANENPTDPFDVDELTSRFGHSLTWDRFHRLESIYSFIDYLATTYPSIISVEVIGKTYENRPIKMLKLRREGGRPNKKAIFMDSGIHAREWIAPAVLTYIIKELVENPSSYDCILNDFDWYFIPVLNPDGYEFTHTKDRMWRKSRSPVRKSLVSRAEDSEPLRSAAYRYGSDCLGTDLNRNFDFQWRSGGSSKHPCSFTYAGEAANSEPETQAFVNTLMKIKDNVEMYVSLHAYSQMWLLPWGYTRAKPEDFSDLFSLARVGAKALERSYNTSYLIGSIPDLLYVASGSSQDWAKGVAGIKYSYTLELRDAGDHGFVLPASQIVPSGEETWAGLFASAKELARRIYSDGGSC